VGESGGRSELVPQVGPCLEWNPPTFRWFVGGQTNLGYNAVDCHVINGNGGRAALIYMNERDERVVLTYAQLLHQVRASQQRCADSVSERAIGSRFTCRRARSRSR
jgi:hypothetical protein